MILLFEDNLFSHIANDIPYNGKPTKMKNDCFVYFCTS